jgi:predicted metal-binding membrane protein
VQVQAKAVNTSLRPAVAPRDAALVLAGVGAITALAWFDLWRRAGAMMPATGGGMDMTGAHMAMAAPPPWNVADLIAAGIMWSVMMTAMMLPAAAPILTLFSAARKARASQPAGVSPAVFFAAGFVLLWTAWSWLAAGIQWILQASIALSPQLTVARAPLAAAILAVAGLYQFTGLKDTCLARCRSPLGFLLSEWHEGNKGALRMGFRYGAFCAGCCWALMGLLFVVGIMNLLWIAILSIFVLAEKTVLRGPWPGRVIGAALILWAVYLLRAPMM